MKPSELPPQFDRIKKGIMDYRANLYKHVGAVGLQFIDSNFRAQGWQNKTLIPWRATRRKKNVFGIGKKVSVNAKGQTVRKGHAMILINSGRLQRSFHANSAGIGRVRWFTDVEYAKAHNEGFKGTVTVKSHQRRILQKQKIYSVKTRKGGLQKVETGSITVKSFSRNMNIPRRQFMPSTNSNSEIFNKQIWETINKDVKNLLKIK